MYLADNFYLQTITDKQGYCTVLLRMLLWKF